MRTPSNPENLFLPLFFFAGLVLALFCVLPDERLVWYVSDDFYYYLRVAKHLAAGNGPTFDGITLTTGFHPLYPFILALFTRLFSLGEPALLRTALVFNSLCFLLTAVFLRSAAKTLWGKAAGAWAMLFWLLNGHALLLVATGMEAPLYGLLIAGYLALLARYVTRENGWIRGIPGLLALGFTAGLGVVARTDGLMLMGLAGLCVFIPDLFAEWRGGEGRGFFTPGAVRAIVRGLTFGLVALIPFALWLMYAARYTGTFMQGSAEMKRVWRLQETGDLSLFGEFIFSAGLFFDWAVKSVVKVPPLKFLLPFAGLTGAALLAKRTRGTRGIIHLLWLLPVLLGLVYAVKFPKAWTWYYTPGTVTLTLFSAGALAAALQRKPGAKLSAYASKVLPLLLIFSLVESIGFLGARVVRGRNRNQADMIVAARWVEQNIEPGTLAAAWNSGIYSWYSGLTVINLDGLINNEIGPMRAAGGLFSDYLRGHGVEIIVDYANMLERHIPEWGEGDVEVLHIHQSRFTRPIAVWRIRRTFNE